MASSMAPFERSSARLNMPPHGFGEHEVPEMPAYVQSYSKRGNALDADQTPVYQQARWGNRTGRGGMNAYLSQSEDPTFFEGTKVKLGDQGVFEQTRWSSGYDWRGGFGIASLSATKNYPGIQTRGGSLRAGGPKRGDIVERPNYWFEQTRPGVTVSRVPQSNDNYSGLYDWKKRTPEIERSNDMMQLRQMIEHNPYHIASHAAKQAKAVYDKEMGNARTLEVPAYQDHLPPGYASPNIQIKETNPYMINRP